MTSRATLSDRLRPALVALALATTAAGTSGCFGRFSLTRRIYSWNDTLENKWLKSIVLWGLVIIPVYPLAGIADGAVLNVVEFWNGANPVPVADKATIRELGDGSVSIAYEGHTYVLTPTGPLTFELARDGVLLGEAEQLPDGSLALRTERAIALFHRDDAQVAVP